MVPRLFLAAVALFFFADLVRHPTEVHYSDHSDLLAEHVPAKRFLVRSFQETGELPLWCPYSFAGSPFVHDPQVGMFYPPHWPLLLLSEESVGAALSWLIVLHVIVAGWGAYACARARGLDVAAALVAGCGFMLAGKWMLHLLAAGHTITVGLAWLPWVLLLLEGAIRRRSFLRATAAGAVFGLMVLGTHPQWTFYAGLFLVLWTLGTALEAAGVFGDEPLCRRRLAGALIRWAAYGAWAATLAVALAAVQLLPTLEAAALSTRAGGVASDEILEGGVRSLLFFVGPALKTTPACLMWEDRGGFGLLWVVAAALAPLLCRGRVRFQAAVCLALVLFAFGGAYLFQPLPGFRVFRQPARMLLIVTLPAALLAAEATQALFQGPGLSAEARARCRGVLLKLTVAAVILAGGFALRMAFQGEVPRPHVYWLSLLVTLPAMYWLLGSAGGACPTRGGQLVWGLLLLLDLWALARPLAAVRPEADVYRPSGCVALLEPARREGRRVLDRDAPGLEAGTPMGGGAPLALVGGLESLRGYNPLDNRRYKEYLQFIAGADEPLRPLDGPFTFPVIGNFPIRNKSLLDLLGTGYALQPTGLASFGDDWRLEGDGWRVVGEDGAPAGYDFATGARRPLPPYTVYQNTMVFPRAFVVPEARPLPPRAQVLEALTAADFRTCVLLEEWDGARRPGGEAAAFRPAEVVAYRPNRVTVHVEPGPAGYLVLADVWYPGWRCTVDGQEAPLYRADYLFRAVELPEGTRRVEFLFEPASYRRGRALSLAALGVVVLIGCAGAARRIWSCLRGPVSCKSVAGIA
ncbi:MAG TPA: hypothetical protein VKA46_15860 [Gemmataceae bacterium]|nr:hypothetical protein [Gemmataceae bacterium]